MRYITVFGLLLISAFQVFASSPVTDVKVLRAEARSLGEGKPTTWIELDRNKDGRTDQAMLLDQKGLKIYEELDYNFDGEMDDFCYYAGGVLVREEIDTNFDGKIDIWVFLQKGIYIERYMRDTDFDGVIDIDKKYGPKK